MIAIGKYRARGVSGEYGKSKNKGTDYVKVQFRITKGEEEGSTISWDGYFTEATEDRTVESLRHCGCTFPNNDVRNLAGIDANEVELVVEHEAYQNANGDDRVAARVAWVNSPGAFSIAEDQKMNDQQLSGFANRMKGKLAAAATKKGSSPNGAPPRTAQAPAQAAAVDDIPF